MTPRIHPFLCRTKLVIATVVALIFSATCNAKPDTIKVEWPNDVAELPGELPSYRLKPVAFRPDLIEHLKTSAKLTDAHKIPLDRDTYDADAIGFVQPDTNASLVISPNEGHLVLSDEQAEGDATKDPVGVPSEAEARALADALLLTLGVTPDRLRLRSPGGEPHVLYSKQTQQRARKKPSDPANPEQTYVRGVRYFQALPGNAAIAGEEVRGVDVWFGAEGRISLLSVNWLNAYPAGASPSASRADIEKRILAGKGTWQSPLPADVQTLRVTQQRIVYRDPMKLSGVLTPSLQLTVQVESAAGALPNAFTCSALADVGADEKTAR
jgi:hypothetical protein